MLSHEKTYLLRFYYLTLQLMPLGAQADGSVVDLELKTLDFNFCFAFFYLKFWGLGSLSHKDFAGEREIGSTALKNDRPMLAVQTSRPSLTHPP